MEIESVRSRLPKLYEAMALTAAIILILTGGSMLLGIAVQLSLFLSTVLACGFAARLGYTWKQVEEMIRKGLEAGLLAMLINLLIGMLIASLCACGTIPYLVSLGLKAISPRFFYISAFLLCCLFSGCVGSSYTTVGTVGVALMGVAAVMDVSRAPVCGAILGGAYFGEKLSPISEATNTVSVCADAQLSRHIRAMCYVILPAAGLTAVIYLFVGVFSASRTLDPAAAMELEQAFTQVFWFGPALLLPIGVLVVMILKKYPALVTLTAGIAAGSALSVLAQKFSVADTAQILMDGFSIQTGSSLADEILKKGGLRSMNDIVTVMACGMPLGGVLKGTRVLEILIHRFRVFVKTRLRVVVSSVVCSVLVGGMTGSNYPAYLLTSAAFEEAYDDFEMDRSMLSRSCEMSAFGGVVLPWTSTGVFMSSVLGVPTTAYAPYFLFGMLVPLLTVFCCLSGWGMVPAGGSASLSDSKTQN